MQFCLVFFMLQLIEMLCFLGERIHFYAARDKCFASVTSLSSASSHKGFICPDVFKMEIKLPR